MKKLILTFVLLISMLFFVGCPDDNGENAEPTPEPSILTFDHSDGTYDFPPEGEEPTGCAFYVTISEAISSGSVVTITVDVSGLSIFKQAAIMSNIDEWVWPVGTSAVVWNDSGIPDGTNLTAVLTATTDLDAGTAQIKFWADNMVAGGDPPTDATIIIANLNAVMQ